MLNDSAFTIRHEQPGDESGIRAVHIAAFPEDVEARIVDLLREQDALTISLVAVRDNQVVGHIAFSPVRFEHESTDGLGLGPVAALPDHQGKGIGGALIRAGLDACRTRDVPFVVVLGEPAYYGRFGFVPASRFDLRCIYHDGDAFQAIELREDALTNQNGTIYYHASFDNVDSI